MTRAVIVQHAKLANVSTVPGAVNLVDSTVNISSTG